MTPRCNRRPIRAIAGLSGAEGTDPPGPAEPPEPGSAHADVARGRRAGDPRASIQDMLDRESQRMPLSLVERETLIGDVLNELFGLGPLEALLKDPTSPTSWSTRVAGLHRARTDASRRPTSCSATTGT